MTVLIKAEWDKKFNERERDSEAIFLMAAEVCLGYVYRTTDDGTYIGHMGSGFSAPITYVGADLDEAKRSVEAQCGAFAPTPASAQSAPHQNSKEL